MEWTGLLIDEDGRPLSGLNVSAFGSEPEGMAFSLLGYDTSDEDGYFAIEGDPSATTSLRMRFDVLDGQLDLVHRRHYEVADEALSSPAPLRLVVPMPPLPAYERHSPAGEERVVGIRVTPGEVELPLGGRVILLAEAHDVAGTPVHGVAFRWDAYNAAGDEVPVSQAGELVGHAPGRLAVTATGAGQSGTAFVTVRDPREVPPGSETFKTALAAAATEDADTGPRWNDTNARSACVPANRVGLGWSGANWTPDRPWLGPRTVQATEAVTVGSANFTFTAPVVDLPGRGLDLRLDLVYNSRVWTRTEDQVEFDNDKGWPAPGWSLGFGRVVRLGREGSMMVSPDGTRHPFEVLRLEGDQNRRTEFEGRTTDGTFIDYQHVDDLSGGNQWAQARYPDGTTVEYTARGHVYRQPVTGSTFPSWGILYPTRITDVHGNVISIAYRNNTGPEIDTIVDTLGRSIRFHYDADYGQLTAVTAPGLAGARRTLVRFDIGLFRLTPAFSGLTAITSNNTARIVRAIYYPADYSGYWLREPGTYSAYGMATRVTRHRDMGFDGAPLEQIGNITAGKPVHQRSYNYPLAADPGLSDVPTYNTMTESWQDMDTPPAVTRFAVQTTSSSRSVEVVYPNGTRTRTLSHNRPDQFDDGLPYLEEIYDGSRLVQQTTTIWQQGDFRSPRPARIETTAERTLMTATEYDYGPYNVVTEIREYDFGGTTLLRRTRTEYELSPGYRQRHILRLPRTVEIFDRSDSTPSARTEYVYDSQPLKDAPGVVAHLQSHNPYAPSVTIPPYDEVECNDAPRPRCWTIHHDGHTETDYDPRTRLRGAVTQVTRFADPARRRDPVVERRNYDITGNVVMIQSGRYDRFVRQYSTATQYAYPERDTIGSADPSSQITTSATYDFGTGLAISSTDANGRTTSTQYSPDRLRPDVVTWPTGATTTFAFEHHQQPVTETLHLADGSLAEQRRTAYNGLGLPRRRMMLAAVSDADPPQPLYDISECRYDALGRVWAQCSPYRTGAAPAWVEITRDALGRRTVVRAPDGSETHAYYDERAPRPDILNDLDPTLMGRTVRLVDAWGRERWWWHNALGQLAMCVEPNPDSDGSVLSPGSAVTYYSHNVLGQVVQIVQLGPESTPQNRRFRYDGLGRLTHQLLSERRATLDDAGMYQQPGSASQWSDVVAYADASRPAWRMDARGVKVLFDYGDDPLGRLQSLTYEQSVVPPWVPNPDPRPQPASAVHYAYVTSGDLARLASVSSDDMSRSYAYDTEGRVESVTLTLPDRPRRPFAIDYHYDTAGRLRQLRYPASYGRPAAPRKELDIAYDSGGRVRSLSADGVRHVADIDYAAQGWPTSLTIDADGPHSVLELNEPATLPGLLGRQQVLRDGNALLDLSYEYVRPGLTGTTGQCTSITDHFRPEQSTRYTYDGLARLSQVSAGRTDERPQWTQRYTYDRFGNRVEVAATGRTPDGEPIPLDGLATLEYGRVRPDGLRRCDNRITTSGFAYDEAGNLLRAKVGDGTWRRYRYDDAGRLVSVTDDNGTLLESYAYGACRRRIRTRDAQAGGDVCHVWHDDKVIAEYDVDTPATAWARSFIHLGDRLLCTYSAVQRSRRRTEEIVRYYHPDRLGTRLITTPDSERTVELLTLPYGTLVGDAPPPDGAPVFTSYQRSPTTGLDYAVNRHYAAHLGRFLQSDPAGADAIRAGEPQSNNLYSYCLGDPINNVDPIGLDVCIDTYCFPDGTLFADPIDVEGRWPSAPRPGDSPDAGTQEDLRAERRQRGERARTPEDAAIDKRLGQILHEALKGERPSTGTKRNRCGPPEGQTLEEQWAQLQQAIKQLEDVDRQRQLQVYALRTFRNSVVIFTGWLFATGTGGGFRSIEPHPYKRAAAVAAALAAFGDQLALYSEVENKYCAKP